MPNQMYFRHIEALISTRRVGGHTEEAGVEA